MGSVGGVGVRGWGWSKDGRRVGGLVNSRFLSFDLNAGNGRRVIELDEINKLI